MKLGKIKGDLTTAGIEVESYNQQFNGDYDGYILTYQTKRNTVQRLYGFYGIPLNETNGYEVKAFYR